MIRFSCPGCRHDLSAPDDRAGASARCSFCKATVTIPAAANGYPAPPAPNYPAALPPAPRYGPRPRPVYSVLSVVRLVGWILCGVAALGVLGSYITNLHRAENVMQQLFAAADACAWLIGVYVLARCADAVTKHIEGAPPAS